MGGDDEGASRLPELVRDDGEETLLPCAIRVRDRRLFGLEYIRLSGYTHPMENLALVFQSLEEEIRLRILALLLEEQELCVCDLMAVLQLPQSTVSRHLSHLRNAGWLRDRREAVWVHYSIAKPLGPLQQSLLPVLRHFFHDEAVAKADIGRLRSFDRGSSCA